MLRTRDRCARFPVASMCLYTMLCIALHCLILFRTSCCWGILQTDAVQRQAVLADRDAAIQEYEKVQQIPITTSKAKVCAIHVQ